MRYHVVLYQTVRGDRPVYEFVHNLESAAHAKYLRLIDLLVEYGPQLRMPYAKKLTKHLYELRTSGKSPLRVIYCQIDSIFILLHAFQKQTNKTPCKEVETAEARRLTLT